MEYALVAYNRISKFNVETAGTFDLNVKLKSGFQVRRITLLKSPSTYTLSSASCVEANL